MIFLGYRLIHWRPAFFLAGTFLLLTACNPTSFLESKKSLSVPPTKNWINTPNSTIPGSWKNFIVSVGDRVFFSVNSAKLSREARTVLDAQTRWLKHYRNLYVRIEGHADERGTREYNLALSARRAAVVHNYLLKKGILASRLRTVAYGKERPVSLCENLSCWSQNRRVVVVPTSSRGH
ncbi:MAG: OmpA family protein [Alphaproteobacteria bacterium]|nr:OmpA family protein [Alphaproteobacteria bacterium]